MHRETPVIAQALHSPYLLLVLTTLFWAGNFVLGRAVEGIVPPLALAFWRWAVALAILLPIAWPRLRVEWPLVRAHWISLTVLAVLGVANYNTFAYVGLQYTTATNAVIMVSTTPVLIVALSFALLRITVSARQGLGIVASLMGVLVIVTGGEPQTLLALRLNRGDLWVLGAILSWALYSVCLMKWRPPGLHPLALLSATIAIGVLVLLPFYAGEAAGGVVPKINGVTLASIGYVAVFPSVLAYLFWNRAVAELGANRCGQFLHLIPAFGAIMSMLFLGERLYGFHAVGIGLIALGIYLATVRR